MQNTIEGVAAATRGLGGWAEVRAADHVTRYMRFGALAGSPIVILLPGTTEANVWPELFEAFCVDRRVYLPDLPDVNDRFGQRLRSFLDGLGLPQINLIAPGSFCIPALEFALLDPDRLERLVLVPNGPAEETGVMGAVSTSTPRKTVPVLIVRRDIPAGEAVSLVSDFVAEG